jgi:hypothetical protein
MQSTGQTQEDYLGTVWGAIGQPLGTFEQITGEYDPRISHVPMPWGYDSQNGDLPRTSAVARLFLNCFLQVPCDGNHWIYQSHNEDQPAEKKDPKHDPDVYNNPFVPSFDDQLKSLQSAETNRALYTVCAAETTLEINPLRTQLPIAQNIADYKGGDTAVFATVALTQAAITFNFECERVGEWPSVPEPVAHFAVPGSSIEGWLKSVQIAPIPPTLDASATKKIFHVSARMTYGLNRPPSRDEKIPVGVLPFTNFKPADTALQLSALYADPNQQLLGSETGQSITNAGGY